MYEESGMMHDDGPQRPIDWPACIYHARAKDISVFID